MQQVFCYNHGSAPFQMSLQFSNDQSSGLFFICPTCNNQVKVVLADAFSSDLTKPELVGRLVQLIRGSSTSTDYKDHVTYTFQVEGKENLDLAPIKQFFEEYIRRYEEADINSFIELWDEEAVQETRTSDKWNVPTRRETSRVTILRNYTRLFKQMGRNHYYLIVSLITVEGGSITAKGIYHIEFPAGSADPQRYDGLITFILKPAANNELKIQLLSFLPTVLT